MIFYTLCTLNLTQKKGWCTTKPEVGISRIFENTLA